MTPKRMALLAPAIFGGFDGSTSAVGLLGGVPASHIVIAAINLAIAGGVGMAAGNWISTRSETNLAQSLVIGAATAIGTVLPAVPYLTFTGTAALIGTAVVLLLLGAVITGVRSSTPSEEGAPPESVLRSAAETYGVLVLVCAAVAACGLFTAGGVG